MPVLRIALLALIPVVAPAAPAAVAEGAPEVSVAILPPELKQSVHHTVEQVEVDGRFLRYRLTTDFGTWIAGSTPLLRARVEEATILSQAVNQFARQDEQMGEELRGQLSVRADSAIDILTRPVETAAELAGQLADNLNETLTGAPARPEEQAGTEYGGQASLDPGVALHRRNVAAQWGLDVYSSNPAVQEFLDAVAHARAGGRISAGTPAFINTGQKRSAIAAADIDAGAAAEMKARTAKELAAAVSARFASMQIPKETIDEFMGQPAYSLRNRSRISFYLEALDGVHNRAAFLEAAAAAENESVAFAFEEAAMMLVHYHRHVEALEKIHSGDNLLQGITAGARVVYLLTADILYWSADTQALFDELGQRADRAGFNKWELLTAALVTPRARDELERRGFLIRNPE